MTKRNETPYAPPKADLGFVLPAASLPAWLAAMRVFAFSFNALGALLVCVRLIESLINGRSPVLNLNVVFSIAALAVMISNMAGMFSWRYFRSWLWLLVVINLFVGVAFSFAIFPANFSWAAFGAAVMFVASIAVEIALWVRGRREVGLEEIN